ncbi:MAG TPA: AI-2E family transporter [Candidatus Limnocylindrales bacterium]|nr:AI-2E family transporter [Candidatus Limnocylindrales bacterium]
MGPIRLSQRQDTLITALLVLGVIALASVVIFIAASVFYAFGDTILVFFLAWLLAFILSPIVTRLTSAIPFLPRVVATIVVYAVLFAFIVLVVILLAGALASSIVDFVASVPTLRDQLPDVLRAWQNALQGFGLQVDLVAQADDILNAAAQYATQLVGPVQQLAVASIGAMGTLLLVLILSLYMVVDRDQISTFLFTLVPKSRQIEARLLERSVSRSFGGFLRGQAILGVVYAAVALLTSAILKLDYPGVTTALSGVLMAIPFFGPFVAWAPPVIVAFLTQSGATLPAFILMGIGWLVVMNVLQPRLMQEAVGIHPIVVLGSVLVGAKVAGIAGAIFGIPIAAVISAFFFHYLAMTRDTAPVATRAAKRVEEREGRPIRVPREPAPGVDSDVP